MAPLYFTEGYWDVVTFTCLPVLRAYASDSVTLSDIFSFEISTMEDIGFAVFTYVPDSIDFAVMYPLKAAVMRVYSSCCFAWSSWMRAFSEANLISRNCVSEAAFPSYSFLYLAKSSL